MKALEAIRILKENPVAFARLCGVTPWEGNVKLLQTLKKSKYAVVIGANSVGKSYSIAAFILWYFAVHSDALIVVTSPSYGQLRRGLWRYVRSMANRFAAPLGVKVTEDKIYRGDHSWIWAVSTNMQERLQGIHGRRLMFVVDEGSGVPQWITEVILSSVPDKVIYSGNPLEPRGPLWEAWNDPSFAHISISALDFPNVKQGKQVIPGGVTREQVEMIRRKWGERHPVYVARILGRFPTGNVMTVIDRDLLAKAFSRQRENGPAYIGVDIARRGTDRTVAAIIKGNSLIAFRVYPGQDLMGAVGWVVNLIEEFDPMTVVVDETGLGGGVVARLREIGHNVIGVNFGASAPDPVHYVNMRAQLYFNLREALNEWLALDEAVVNPEVQDELVFIEYDYDSKGRLKLQDKAVLRASLGRSPDFADALALAVWAGSRPKTRPAVLPVVFGNREEELGAYYDQQEVYL